MDLLRMADPGVVPVEALTGLARVIIRVLAFHGDRLRRNPRDLPV